MADENPTGMFRLDPFTELVTEVRNLSSRVTTLTDKVESNYVTQDQFDPIKRIVYGLVALVLAGFGAGLVNLIMVTKSSVHP